MLRFKQFDEQKEKDFQEYERLNFFFENFEYFQDTIVMEESTEEFEDLYEAKNKKETIEATLEAHARNHLEPQIGESPADHAMRKKNELASAHEYFSNLDMRSPAEIKQGEENNLQREKAAKDFVSVNAAKKPKDRLNPNSTDPVEQEKWTKAVRKHQDDTVPIVNGAKPIKFNSEAPFSDTSKMKAHTKGGAYIDRNGEEPTITGFQMTPGTNVVNDAGNKIVSCPSATKSCEGGEGGEERSTETSLPHGADCLAVNGNNAQAPSRRAMKARLNAITNPLHQKHAAVIIANELLSQNEKAAKAAKVTTDENGEEKQNIGRLHFRPNNTSDVSFLHGIVRSVNDTIEKKNSDKAKIAKPEEKDELGNLKPKFQVHKIKSYAYTSRPLLNHVNTDFDYRVSSLKGPAISRRDRATENEQQKIRSDKADSERERNQDDVIYNLMHNGERAAAYGALGALRGGVNRAKAGGETQEDPRRKVKAFVFHSKKHGIQKFAAHGNDIETAYGKDTGDLRSDDRTADQITDEYGMSGDQKRELTHNSDGTKKGRITTTTLTGSSAARLQKSKFVYPVNDRTLDAETGELHVDAPKEHSDRILDKNISHHLKNKNHLLLTQSHNEFLKNGDHESASKIKSALVSNGIDVKHNKAGEISHINGVSMKQFEDVRSHNINKTKVDKHHKEYQKLVKGGYSDSKPAQNVLSNIAKLQKTVDNQKLLATKGGVTPTIDKESGKITHLNGIPLK